MNQKKFECSRPLKCSLPTRTKRTKENSSGESRQEEDDDGDEHAEWRRRRRIRNIVNINSGLRAQIMGHSQDSLAKPKNVRMASHHPRKWLVGTWLGRKESARYCCAAGRTSVFRLFLVLHWSAPHHAKPGQSAASGLSNESDNNCRARERN